MVLHLVQLVAPANLKKREGLFARRVPSVLLLC